MQHNNNELDLTALVNDLGIDKLSPEEQDEVLSNILDALNSRVLTRVIHMLTEEQQNSTKALIEQNPQNIQQIVLSVIPREQQVQIYQEEIDAIRRDMMRDTEQGTDAKNDQT